MREIALKDDGLHIGALVTLAQLAASTRTCRRCWPRRRARRPPRRSATWPRWAATWPSGCAAGGSAARTFPCARKEGNQCYAQKGENKYHAVFDNSDCAAVAPSSLSSPLVVLDAMVVTTKRTHPHRAVLRAHHGGHHQGARARAGRDHHRGDRPQGQPGLEERLPRGGRARVAGLAAGVGLGGAGPERRRRSRRRAWRWARWRWCPTGCRRWRRR